MSETTASLSDLMNAMVARLEYVHSDEMQAIPESQHWHMIELYIQVDSVLAALYKQYCAAKENLGKLLVENGSQDPMTEIAWDMHDSLRSAIETRLIELKQDDAMTGRIAAMQAHKISARMPNGVNQKKSTVSQLNEMMAFVLWAGMAMKSNVAYHHDIRQDFGRAS